MAEIPPPSVCPFCRARGVRQFEPLVIDGIPRDVPYCGQCGRNYPEPKQPRETARPTESEGRR